MAAAGATQGSKLSCKVAVIGAGAAGLATARELRAEGHSVVVFEQGARLGGVWVYSEAVDSDPLGRDAVRTRVHSSLYSGLRTNLPRQVMSFRGFPFTPAAMGARSIDPRTFPRHEEASALARTHAGAAPAAAAADGTACWQQRRWLVEARRLGRAGGVERGADGGADITSEVFDAVMVANGHFSEPHLPHVAGSSLFPEKQLHSHSYRRADAFRGQRVAVVGASFSARDISRLVAAEADRVFLCARQWNAARALGGPFGPRSNVERRGMISRLTAEGGAEFAAGPPAASLDAVIYCTGYEYRLPFLDLRALGLSTEQQRVAPLFQHLFAPAYGPGIAFIGLPFRAASFPLFELQAKLCARLLSGRASLPPSEEMAAWVEGEEARRVAEGRPPGATHRFDHRQMAHHWWLATSCGPDVRRVPDWTAAALHAYWAAAWAAFAVQQWARALSRLLGARKAA